MGAGWVWGLNEKQLSKADRNGNESLGTTTRVTQDEGASALNLSLHLRQADLELTTSEDAHELPALPFPPP